jgi:uncharacterized protein (DUF1778 family)
MTNSASKAQNTSGSVSINLQISKELHLELLTASSMNGITVEQFILNAAYKAALKITERDDVVLLNQEAWDKLSEVIQNPPRPSPLLQKLMRA